MSQIFETQSLLTINLETNFDISLATVTKILYKKPNGVKGSWTAAVSGNNLIYNLTNGEIDQPGLWRFQSYVEIGGLKAYGKVVTQDFRIPLDV